MQVRRLADAKPYVAPNHRDCSALRLFGAEAGGTQTLIVGLPGSPWAAFVGFEVFVRPVLRAMLGQRPALPMRQIATLATPLQVRPGVTSFIPASLQPRGTDWLALPVENLLELARAESHPVGLIVVPPHRRCLPSGSH